jgi:hypothetical protein
MIFRNNRTKGVIFGTFCLFFVGLNLLIQTKIIYQNKIFNNILLLIASFTITGYIGGYFNNVLCWENNFFDFINTSYINLKNYIIAKYIFSIFFTILGLIVGGTIIFSFFKNKYIIYLIALVFYNIGIVYPFMIFTSIINPSKISLDESALFNYSGLNSLDWFLEIFLIIIPLMVIIFFSTLFNAFYGFILIGFIGLISIMLHKKIFKIMYNIYFKNKYKINNIFRGN